MSLLHDFQNNIDLCSVNVDSAGESSAAPNDRTPADSDGALMLTRRASIDNLLGKLPFRLYMWTCLIGIRHP